MLASYHGHAPLVKLLLQHGADPNSLNDRGQSPLAGAVFKGESEVIEVRFLTIPSSALVICSSLHSPPSFLRPFLSLENLNTNRVTTEY
jgi:ankyrin repeat protein